MSENKNASATWVDPDDAPDLADADLGQAVWCVAGKEVPAKTGMAAMRRAARGRPVGSTKPETKRAVTVRYSPDVLAAFKATGAGWQARMDAALKDWLKTHSPA
ncbi:MAG: BrnA antitoxin family protein [Burkholderiaceae bacterium]|nr:BrnA antitoxin family protein [Burkholderiaceae bacterium]MBX9937150.1 BrnA antitoxin family protein [Burkholderiaceae bacterium]